MAESATFHYEIEYNEISDARGMRSRISGKLWRRLKRIHLESLSIPSLDPLNDSNLMNSHESEESCGASLGDVFRWHDIGLLIYYKKKLHPDAGHHPHINE